MKDIHTMIHSKNIQTNKKTEKSDSILICPICGDDLLINEIGRASCRERV